MTGFKLNAKNPFMMESIDVTKPSNWLGIGLFAVVLTGFVAVFSAVRPATAGVIGKTSGIIGGYLEQVK